MEAFEIAKFTVIIGGLFTLLGVFLKNWLNKREESRKIKREKLEEALEVISKIGISVRHIKTSQFAIIKGKARRELPFQDEDHQKQLKNLLRLYSNEFQEEIEELEIVFRKVGSEVLDISILMDQLSQEEIANMTFDIGSELLNLCKNIENKIYTIFEKI